ncbi:hypothetical protein [Cellulomonas rhizosphaerae]|uniref:Uncharacterized protein n=1 Tax=Cellulomonas rhizosphaerae TaxID=2293719 RepID=A0A413RH49_9CELL|nr:hypothetical protein [Cellulomonas rhizosphaerae]RHA37130.1 hypothetical protein D1825_17770 [Cellulomonas rhizosphaerae]
MLESIPGGKAPGAPRDPMVQPRYLGVVRDDGVELIYGTDEPEQESADPAEFVEALEAELLAEPQPRGLTLVPDESD